MNCACDLCKFDDISSIKSVQNYISKLNIPVKVVDWWVTYTYWPPWRLHGWFIDSLGHVQPNLDFEFCSSYLAKNSVRFIVFVFTMQSSTETPFVPPRRIAVELE